MVLGVFIKVFKKNTVSLHISWLAMMVVWYANLEKIFTYYPNGLPFPFTLTKPH
jgi:hypothetical protein